MAMKTILEAIKKHRGKFSNEDVETIRRAVVQKMADDPRKKVTGVHAPTYEAYRKAIKEHKLDRATCVWLNPMGDLSRVHAQFNIIKEVSFAK